MRDENSRNIHVLHSGGWLVGTHGIVESKLSLSKIDSRKIVEPTTKLPNARLSQFNGAKYSHFVYLRGYVGVVYGKCFSSKIFSPVEYRGIREHIVCAIHTQNRLCEHLNIWHFYYTFFIFGCGPSPMRLFSCIYLSIYSFGLCVDVDEPSNKFSSRGGGAAAAVEFACSIPIDQ